jgi:hypothetical protein
VTTELADACTSRRPRAGRPRRIRGPRARARR